MNPNDKKILAVIPARGGSKGIAHKNITPLAGHPLIHYSISAALTSDRVERVIVSTDDQMIADVALKEGADVPFLRPGELAGDDTPTLPVLVHLLGELKQSEGYVPDAVLLLQPTSPFRTSKHIDESVDLWHGSDADSLVSVIDIPHNFNPVSLMKIQDGLLKPYLEGEGTKILRRQDKPEVFARNGPVILISGRRTLIEKNDLYGERVLPYLMDSRSSLDIDGSEDLELAEIIMNRGSAG